ncbi:MAG: glycosyltransferase family 4 protein [Planctomycetes bacterium]|nr:glycosyltransferase family 4 protein [Planctomycetota bacterium]
MQTKVLPKIKALQRWLAGPVENVRLSLRGISKRIKSPGLAMKLFGTTQPFIESRESSFKIGRLVANYDFFKALFKYSDFDEFHIFCPNYANCKLTEKRISEEDIPSDRKAKIKVFHIASLKKSIIENNYHIFHLGGWGFFFPGLIHLRNIYSPKPFPITGITHSLNAKQASFHALKVCTAPTMPFDSIVCTSNCGKKVLESLFEATENNFKQMNIKYRGRMDVIPLGIDDTCRTIPNRLESRKSLGIDADSFVILSLGRLTSVDKMDFAPFLACLRRFTEKNKARKIVLILAGRADNHEQRLIRSLLQEKQLEEITKLFINFGSNKKSVFYSAADVYTAPVDNFQETFGLSVVEAMAHECAVVISDFNGYSEIVDHGINGIKIPTFWGDVTKEFEDVSEIMNFSTYQLLLSQSVAVDVDKMSEALQELLDKREKRDLLGKAAREKVERNYFWSDIIKQYCTLWNELSEQAQCSSVEARKPKNPWEIDYRSVFSHYSSKIVSADSMICLSEYGKEVLKSGDIPVSYSDVGASVIIPKLVAAALKVIAPKLITTAQFIDSLQKYAAISDSTALYYLLWMAKYNMVRISD